MAQKYYLPFSNNKKISLYNLAYIDPFTELGNYYYFCKEGNKFIQKNTAPKYILILDIEKFRAFNSYYGHDKGRELIIQLAKRLVQILKDYINIICRFTNDIFAILIETNDRINIIADNLFGSLRHIEVNGEIYNIYPIIGIYKIKNDENILLAIDKAMTAHDEIIGDYSKKYNMYSEETEKVILEEQQIETIMEEALENGEFKVFYQPKVDLKTNNVISCEALVRWFREGKFISPNRFIPLFEKNRFIIKLDKYIFKKACEDIQYINKLLKEKDCLKNYNHKNPHNQSFTYNSFITASINISKEHFAYDNFIQEYYDMVKQTNVPRELIELEITESASVYKGIDLKKITKDMKRKGFTIALDDFGTGYSSLNMLQDLSIDVLKIDKSFIDRINESNLVKYIIDMAKDFNIKTVAEGVETKEQIDILKNMGCDMAQGYYYAKPLSREDFVEYLTNRVLQ